MQLTAEEKQMIEAMRMANKAKDTEVGYSRMAKKDLLSAIDYNIQIALESSNPDIRQVAGDIKKQMVEAGYKNLAEAEKDISMEQIQQLINVVHEGAKYDGAIDYSLVQDQAILFKEVPDDESYQEIQSNSVNRMKNEDMNSRVEEIPIVNELTGKQYIQRIYPDGTKEIVEYNPEAEYQATIEEAEAEFLEAIQGGASPDMVNFNQGLVDK
jgi:hypothetical protein